MTYRYSCRVDGVREKVLTFLLLLLCQELGRLATKPPRGLLDRTPAKPPALTRRRPEY